MKTWRAFRLGVGLTIAAWMITLAVGFATAQIAPNQITVIRTQSFAFASIPSALAVKGALVTVTDSNTATWGANVAAGGSNNVLAFYNGSNWTVAGK